MKKIVIVGMGETSRDVRFFIERYQLFEVAGYAVNSEYISGAEQNGLPVFALEKLEQYIDKNKVGLYIAISEFQYLNREKRRVYTELKERGFSFPNLISPKATILTNEIGEGNWICDFAYLDFQTRIGSNCVLRNYAYVGHYAMVGSHNFLGARSMVGGNSMIGDQCFVGINATIFNNIHVGNKCLIGGELSSKRVCRTFPDAGLSAVPWNIRNLTKQKLRTNLSQKRINVWQEREICRHLIWEIFLMILLWEIL